MKRGGEQDLSCSQLHLMEFERHSDAWHDDFPQKFHVSKDPLIPNWGDAKISLEEGMQSIQEGLQVTREGKKKKKKLREKLQFTNEAGGDINTSHIFPF